MSKRQDYEAQTESLILPILEKYGFELYDVEYVKEGSTNYLRAYIDKPGGIAVNDCETVSRALSDLLDKEDYIADSYILEVSSPGLDRELKKPKDFQREQGKLVDVSLFAQLDGEKVITGQLKSYDGENVTVDERVIPMDKVAKVNLHIDF